MTVRTINRLAVHYEVSGDGPVLLMISAGGVDAAGYDAVVPQLAAQYTVVTYQPRVDVAAEDALAILDAVAGDEPAYVFGSGSGAIIGLELLVRHPERVRLLVAHEPPAVELDVAALVALEDQLIPAVGSEPSEVLTVEPILALSDRVGWRPIAFPGGHGGYAERPFEFATLLLKVLANGGLR